MIDRYPRTLMDAAPRRVQRRSRRAAVLAVEAVLFGWSGASLVLAVALLVLLWSGHLLIWLR